MGTSCKPVQDPDSEGGVRMAVSRACVFTAGMRVQVDMGVARAVVLVGMGVNLKAERDPDTP